MALLPSSLIRLSVSFIMFRGKQAWLTVWRHGIKAGQSQKLTRWINCDRQVIVFPQGLSWLCHKTEILSIAWPRYPLHCWIYSYMTGLKLGLSHFESIYLGNIGINKYDRISYIINLNTIIKWRFSDQR